MQTNTQEDLVNLPIYSSANIKLCLYEVILTKLTADSVIYLTILRKILEDSLILDKEATPYKRAFYQSDPYTTVAKN